MGIQPLWASGCAIEVSILSNFILNDQWTFKDQHYTSWSKRLAKFHWVSLIGAIVQWSLFWTLSQWYLTWDTQVNGALYLCQLIGIGVGTIWNFLANLMWTWKRSI